MYNRLSEDLIKYISTFLYNDKYIHHKQHNDLFYD